MVSLMEGQPANAGGRVSMRTMVMGQKSLIWRGGKTPALPTNTKGDNIMIYSNSIYSILIDSNPTPPLRGEYYPPLPPLISVALQAVS